MSKNKYKNEKDNLEKKSSNFSEGGFDKSILSDYSKWREDYSLEEEIKEEVTEIVEENQDNISFDFKENLINSEIDEDTFTKKILEDESVSDKKGENIVEDTPKLKDSEQKEEILTETQRLQLIYGNVVPLHERRRRGALRNKKQVEQEEVKVEKVVEDEITKEDFKEVKKNKKVENNKFEEKKLENEKTESKKENKDNELDNKIAMPKVPMFLKGLFGLTIVFAIALVSFFGFKAYYSLNLRLPAIISGLNSKNENFYKNNMFYKNENINDENAKFLIKTFTDDETKLHLVEKWIKEDAENLKKDADYISQRPIRLQKQGKIKGIFDDYKIVFDSVKFKVEKSRIVNTSVLVDGNEEEVSDKVYEIFPGVATVFYYDNGVKLRNEIEIFPDETNEVKSITYGEGVEYALANELFTLDTNSNESSFKINTRDEESILFVNDKNTGITVKEFNTYNSTNIKKDDILKVVTKMPWGYTISDGVAYDGSRSLNVSASLSDPRLKEISISKTLLLLKQFMYARGNKDMTALTVLVGNALETTKVNVQEVINSGREFVGGYPSMEFDLNSFEVSEYGNTYKMFIGGHLLVQETSYGPNDRVPDITKVTPEERKVGFHFVYDKDKKDWFCEIWGFTTRHITRDNIKSVDLSRDMILK